MLFIDNTQGLGVLGTLKTGTTFCFKVLVGQYQPSMASWIIIFESAVLLDLLMHVP